MRRVQCTNCGQRYDYDRDDFCPKCGAYNPPPDSGATRLEQELLARFESGHQNQKRAREQARFRTAETAKRSAAAHPTQGSGPEVGRQRHSARLERCDACRPPRRRNGGRAAVLGVVIAVILAIVIPLVTVLVEVVEDAIWDYRYQMYTYTQPEYEPARGEVTHSTREDFLLNGAVVSIKDSWWPETGEDAAPWLAGYRCLLVDVWITDGLQMADAPIEPPWLLLPDGTQLPAECDPELLDALTLEYGVHCITLEDCRETELLYGSFVFFVPEYAQAEEFTLLLREYDPGVTDPRATHLIPLDS